MITLGLAFAIGDEPHRLALVHSNEALLARLARNSAVMSNPKLRHAVEFATRGAKIEATIAAEKVNAMLERANAKGADLPPLPPDVNRWPGWIDGVAGHVKPSLPGHDAGLAFEAGTAAAALMQAWGGAEKVAYLRAADPDQADLSAEAARHAATSKRSSLAFLDRSLPASSDGSETTSRRRRALTRRRARPTRQATARSSTGGSTLICCSEISSVTSTFRSIPARQVSRRPKNRRCSVRSWSDPTITSRGATMPSSPHADSTRGRN